MSESTPILPQVDVEMVPAPAKNDGDDEDSSAAVARGVRNAVADDGTAAAVTDVPRSGDKEFVVHTKHTCDGCFVQPIVGRRYTSTVQTNYDLCGRCFDAYKGPELGLSEEVLLRDKKHSRGFILKLKIDNGGSVQVRRINVCDLWVQHGAQAQFKLSFRALMHTAFKYGFPKVKSIKCKAGNAVLDSFIAEADATYLDADGDKITMTSSKELMDSFLQVMNKFPNNGPFRVTVTIPDGFQPFTAAPNNACSMTVKHGPKKKRMAMKMMAFDPKKFDKELFVHARHTCDGCSKSPIIGTRYHATKIPDFDLCATCYEKYEGEDLDFKPDVHERDRSMQPRWLRKQMKGFAAHGSPPCQGFAGFSTPCEGFTIPLKDSKEAPEPAAAKSKEGVSPEKAKDPPAAAVDETFLSDADGNGSIAEAIGRTLDVCVQAIEDAMVEEGKQASQETSKSKSAESKQSIEDDVAAATIAAADAFSVASSVVSGMTDILKKMDDVQVVDVNNTAAANNSATDASEPGDAKEDGSFEMSMVEDVSGDEDDWSVVSDEKKEHVAAAANAKEGEEETKEAMKTDQSISSVEPLSPVVLAKWDKELFQLHELGFLNDRKNIDVLEQLEASHIGSDSDEKVTVQSAVEHLLGRD